VHGHDGGQRQVVRVQLHVDLAFEVARDEGQGGELSAPTSVRRRMTLAEARRIISGDWTQELGQVK
jgi:hypothetical protein